MNDKHAFPQWVQDRTVTIGKDGGIEHSYQFLGGLTKREWFAGQALRLIIEADIVGYENAAKWSVGYADALIAELNKEGTGE